MKKIIFFFFSNFFIIFLSFNFKVQQGSPELESPRTQKPKNPRTREPEKLITRGPEVTREPDIKTIFIKYQIFWILQEPLITAETKSSDSYYTIQLIQMCNANNKYIDRALSREQILFNLSKVPNRYNFQHHSAKGGNYKISPQNVSLPVFGFP